jgi:putative hydrolase
MRTNRSCQLVLAHVFSILPKGGLTEAEVPDTLVHELVTAAAETNTIVEVSERWHCPSARIVGAMRAGGVPLVCSTDSHAAATIGRYQYVRSTVEALA